MSNITKVEAFCSRLLLAIKYDNANLDIAIRTIAEGLTKEDINEIRNYLTAIESKPEQLHLFRSRWQALCNRYGLFIEGHVEKFIVDALPR